MALSNRCAFCRRLVEYDEYEEAWFHIDNDHMGCGLDDHRVATPLYVIEEIPG